MTPLISADVLAAALDRVGVFDVRWDLTDPARGRNSYEEGHIPGAVFVDLDDDLASPPGMTGRHPLPEPAGFAATLGRLGIEPGTHVVVYDDAGGRVAARMWWMLKAIGHEETRVLDGGLQAWVEAGGGLDPGWVEPVPTQYPAPERFEGVIGPTDVPGRTLIDARAGERYRGEVEPIDPKAGHIPGAINIPTDRNLDVSGRFRSAIDLALVYDDVPADPAVSCGSGVTACHAALAMVVAGMPMPDVYVGSFSEWSRRDLDVSTGPMP